MQAYILMFNQDDPAKCTAAKLVKFGIAKQTRKTFPKSILLDPYAPNYLLRKDESEVEAITAIDCSWERANQVFVKRFSGISRKLPPLLAGNPVNYSKTGRLTTAEAIAGSLFITGYDDLAFTVLNKFKWGHTFYDLNKNLLEEYVCAETQEEIIEISRSFGIVMQGTP